MDEVQEDIKDMTEEEFETWVDQMYEDWAIAMGLDDLGDPKDKWLYTDFEDGDYVV